MKQKIKNILFIATITIITTLLVIGIANRPNTMLGTAVTQITGSDKLSDLDTLINTISSELNVGKMEISTTTLPLLTTLSNLASIGTITTGVWNGTGIDVAKQGTGTTTPTLHQVMIGNDTSGFKVIGFGSSGQFLTSAGTGADPSWTTSSINLASDYLWTGTHNWSGATLLTDLNASSTLTINDVALKFTSSLPNTSTSTMVIDTDGTIRYAIRAPEILVQNGSALTTAGATTTVLFYTMPANTMGADSILDIYGGCLREASGGTGTYGCQIQLGDGTSSTTLISFGRNSGQQVGYSADFYVKFINQGSQTVQDHTSRNVRYVSNTEILDNGNNGTTYDTATQLYISFQALTVNDATGFKGITITKY